MPRGEHFKQVEDDEILDQFDVRADDLGRKLFTPTELARDLSVTPEAVRQRLVRLQREERVDRVEIGGSSFWHLKGEKVFADGGLLSSPTYKISKKVLTEIENFSWGYDYFKALAISSFSIAVVSGGYLIWNLIFGGGNLPLLSGIFVTSSMLFFIHTKLGDSIVDWFPQYKRFISGNLARGAVALFFLIFSPIIIPGAIAVVVTNSLRKSLFESAETGEEALK